MCMPLTLERREKLFYNGSKYGGVCAGSKNRMRHRFGDPKL